MNAGFGRLSPSCYINQDIQHAAGKLIAIEVVGDEGTAVPIGLVIAVDSLNAIDQRLWVFRHHDDTGTGITHTPTPRRRPPAAVDWAPTASPT